MFVIRKTAATKGQKTSSSYLCESGTFQKVAKTDALSFSSRRTAARKLGTLKAKGKISLVEVGSC